MTTPPGPAPFRRAELEARFAALRQRTPGPVFFFGPSALVAAVLIGAHVFGHLAFDLLRAVLWFAIPPAFVTLLIWNARQPRVLQDLGLLCPACRATLDVQTVIRTGVCGACAGQLIDPSEVTPPPPMPQVPRWRTVIDVIVLVTLTVWFFAWSCTTVRGLQRDECRDRYRSARTARDTLRVDRRCSWTKVH